MNTKKKIAVTLTSLVLIMGLMVFGVFAAISQSVSITNKISFTAKDVVCNVVVTGTNGVADMTGITNGTFTIGASTDTTVFPVTIPKQDFAGEGAANQLVYTITITNTGSRVIAIALTNPTVTGVTISSAISGVTGGTATAGKIASGATGNVATITVTMLLISQAKDLAVTDANIAIALSAVPPAA